MVGCRHLSCQSIRLEIFEDSLSGITVDMVLIDFAFLCLTTRNC
uniref:Uncharacterized protein n=1 Tax=Rhizophora mucronata TaxID=61149 RepID=A0A2P2J1J2_RHIMU